MGNTTSSEQPVARGQSSRLHQRRIESTWETLDEKFDAIRIDPSPPDELVDEDDSSHISGTKVERYISSLLKDPKNRLGLSALSAADPSIVLEQPAVAVKDTQTFNVAIPREGSPITNQRSSGRCWLFAATNVFRIAIQQKYDIEKFELSQAYLFFWDKIEKSNYFLEAIIATADEAIDSRLVSTLNAAPVNDGGQWDMVVNLVIKYGIVPQTLYPDSWNAQNSAVMDRLLTTRLREGGIELRKIVANEAKPSQIATAKAKILQDVVRIVTLCLGPPPSADEVFKWEFYNSKHEFKCIELTPIEFAESTRVNSFISLVNDPRNSYNQLLTVKYLGNVWDGQPITYVNVDNSVLKAACVAMLKKGLPIFFGSDVGQQSDRVKGIMDVDLVDYELGFNVKLNLSKAERLLTGESQMTHAMVLTAVHLDSEGKPVRWRVENSWSTTAGTDGYFVMSDRWMDQFCYQAVVDSSVVRHEVRDILTQKPKVLPLWDPMGALA